MNKWLAFLEMVFLISACTAVRPNLQPTDTSAKTPAPTPTATRTPGWTATPTSPSPTITAIQHPPLNTNGPYLVYLTSQAGWPEIMLLDANGIGQKLIPYPTNATYLPYTLSSRLSPDGKWLAYYTGSAGKCFDNPAADTADLTLNLLNLTDGKSQIVTKLLSRDYPVNFVQAAQQLKQAGIINDGFEISAAALQNAFVCGMEASAWSPDGRTLAFAGQMAGISSDVYLYDMFSHAIKRLSSEPEEVEAISWSPNGQRIIEWSNFGVGEGMAHDVYIIALDGRVIFNRIVHRGFLDWLYGATYTFWGSETGMGQNQFGFVDSQTGNVRIWDQSYTFLAVSADQQWLVGYYRGGKETNLLPGFYLINLSTYKAKRVELLGTYEDIHSSFQDIGSGDHTFGFINTITNNLYFLSPDGKITSTGINAACFSLSPDRHYLVAIGQKIHILKADGAPIRDVDLPAHLENTSVFAIIWRPDSSGLFFTYSDSLLSDKAPLTQLYALDLLTGDPSLVDPDSPTRAEDFVWVARPK
jgi:Tol biopolymer transport system component